MHDLWAVKAKPSSPKGGAVDFPAVLAEAHLILSRHDGIHLLHSDAQALAFLARMAEEGDNTHAEKVEEIMGRMRQADRTGKYPISPPR